MFKNGYKLFKVMDGELVTGTYKLMLCKANIVDFKLLLYNVCL